MLIKNQQSKNNCSIKKHILFPTLLLLLPFPSLCLPPSLYLSLSPYYSFSQSFSLLLTSYITQLIWNSYLQWNWISMNISGQFKKNISNNSRYFHNLFWVIIYKVHSFLKCPISSCWKHILFLKYDKKPIWK